MLSSRSIQRRRSRAPAGWARAYAADLFFTKLVQPLGPSSRGIALRYGYANHARVRWNRSERRTSARLNHCVQVSSFARET